jgi:hypothetical protein
MSEPPDRPFDPLDPIDPVDPFDGQLRARLERLALAIPVDPPGRRETARARWRPRSWRASLGAGVLLLVVSLGAAATLIQIGHPASSSSAFAAGGPLHCSRLDQMTPPDAAAWLTAHGLRARWQVEDRAESSFAIVDSAPDRGVIVEALALSDGSLVILVDRSRDTPAPPHACP